MVVQRVLVVPLPELGRHLDGLCLHGGREDGQRHLDPEKVRIVALAVRPVRVDDHRLGDPDVAGARGLPQARPRGGGGGSAGAGAPPSDTVIVNGTMIEADRAEPAGSVPSIAGPTAPWARATSTGLGAVSLSIRSRR